ncbi:MAG: HepT-like ribonuclease domain-containing protein [Balneolaceae bacterium]
MNQKRRVDMYLDDILTSMNRIDEYIDGISLEEFKSNNLIVDAVTRNFEIIGEASKHIPENIRKR